MKLVEKKKKKRKIKKSYRPEKIYPHSHGTFKPKYRHWSQRVVKPLTPKLDLDKIMEDALNSNFSIDSK